MARLTAMQMFALLAMMAAPSRASEGSQPLSPAEGCAAGGDACQGHLNLVQKRAAAASGAGAPAKASGGAGITPEQLEDFIRDEEAVLEQVDAEAGEGLQKVEEAGGALDDLEADVEQLTATEPESAAASVYGDPHVLGFRGEPGLMQQKSSKDDSLQDVIKNSVAHGQSAGAKLDEMDNKAVAATQDLKDIAADLEVAAAAAEPEEESGTAEVFGDPHLVNFDNSLLQGRKGDKVSPSSMKDFIRKEVAELEVLEAKGNKVIKHVKKLPKLLSELTSDVQGLEAGTASLVQQAAGGAGHGSGKGLAESGTIEDVIKRAEEANSNLRDDLNGVSDTVEVTTSELEELDDVVEEATGATEPSVASVYGDPHLLGFAQP